MTSKPPWVAAALAVALAAATAATAHTAGYQPGSETLRLEASNPLDSVDPAVADTPASLLLENAACARLYDYSGSTRGPNPEIAAALPIPGADHNRPKQWKTYTIRLRPGFRFQDGTPVTAYSFADALDRDADPDLASPAVSDMQEIVGLGAVLDGDSRTLAGVVPVDNTTLDISTVRADPGLATTLALTFFCPVEEDTPVAPGGFDFPPSAGPYYVATDSGSSVTFARNRYYTGGETIHFDRIVVTSGVSLADCRHAVSLDTADLCLDALPKEAASSPVPALAANSSLNPSVGCLGWNAVVGLELAGACRQRT